MHFKETGVENRTADQTKGLPVSPVSAGLVVVAAVTQHTGGAQSCPVLDLPFSLCSGEAMMFATTEHIATWRSLVLSRVRMPKENKASPLFAQQQFAFEGKKKTKPKTNG